MCEFSRDTHFGTIVFHELIHAPPADIEDRKTRFRVESERVIRLIFSSIGFAATGLFDYEVLPNRARILRHAEELNQSILLREDAEDQLGLIVDTSPAALEQHNNQLGSSAGATGNKEAATFACLWAKWQSNEMEKSAAVVPAQCQLRGTSRRRVGYYHLPERTKFTGVAVSLVTETFFSHVFGSLKMGRPTRCWVNTSMEFSCPRTVHPSCHATSS